ncbi:MAG: hypothetical protein IPK26_23765 [Planctomycetes bacterium]|nr:hypothetical protein [Planctomycetota bacterium]
MSAEEQLRRDKEAAARPENRPTQSKIRMPGSGAPSPTAITLDPKDRDLSPEELRRKYKDRLGAEFVSYRTKVTPSEVVPGDGGTLTVTMVLRNDAVLLPSAKNNFEITQAQGAVLLDWPVWRPAGRASAPAMRGKQADDKTATFDLKFAVDKTAQPGNHVVEFAAMYELYNGKTGGWIERFRDNIRAEIKVAGTNAAPVEPPVADAPTTPLAAPVTGPETVVHTQPPESPQPLAARPDAAPPVESSWLPWGVAGGLLLAIGIVALRRR